LTCKCGGFIGKNVLDKLTRSKGDSVTLNLKGKKIFRIIAFIYEFNILIL